MNNWTVVFLVVGSIIVISIIAGVVMTNKALKVGGQIATSGNIPSNDQPESIIN